MEESALGVAGDEKISEAIIAKISNGDAHPIKIQAVNAGMGSHVLKFPISKISIQRIADRLGAFTVWRFTAVDKENVLQAIVVEVQEADASAHGFDQKAIRRFAGKVGPRDAAFLRDIGDRAPVTMRYPR